MSGNDQFAGLSILSTQVNKFGGKFRIGFALLPRLDNAGQPSLALLHSGKDISSVWTYR